MGIYLNGTSAYGLFQNDCSALYYIDKTRILEELVAAIAGNRNLPMKSSAGIRTNPRCICITRPRRFGKTMTANMIASYFGKEIDSSAEFDTL